MKATAIAQRGRTVVSTATVSRRRTGRAATSHRKWPEKIRLEVSRPFERSGHSWFPSDFWLRNAGGIPSQVPSLGGKFHKGPEGTNDAAQVSTAHNESFIVVAVVPEYTGAPLEMTPGEIHAAVSVSALTFATSAPWQIDLLLEGQKQASQSAAAVRLSPPMRKLYRKDYESAGEAFTGEDARRRGAGIEGQLTVNDFKRMGMRG